MHVPCVFGFCDVSPPPTRPHGSGRWEELVLKTSRRRGISAAATFHRPPGAEGTFISETTWINVCVQHNNAFYYHNVCCTADAKTSRAPDPLGAGSCFLEVESKERWRPLAQKERTDRLTDVMISQPIPASFKVFSPLHTLFETKQPHSTRRFFSCPITTLCTAEH